MDSTSVFAHPAVSAIAKGDGWEPVEGFDFQSRFMCIKFFINYCKLNIYYAILKIVSTGTYRVTVTIINKGEAMKKLLFAILALFSLAVVSEVSANYRRSCGSCHKPRTCEKKCPVKRGPCKTVVNRIEGPMPICEKTVCHQVPAPCTGIKHITEETTWTCPTGYQKVGEFGGNNAGMEYEAGADRVADAFEF